MYYKTNLIVMSRTEMESTRLTENDVVISITDPRARLASIQGIPKGILTLKFYDVSDPNNREYPGMTEEDARKLVDFVNRYWGLSENMYVHCEMGISRSAGVAAAISKAKRNDDMYFFQHYYPNFLCYTLTLAEFKRREK